MTIEDIKYYKKNAIEILRKNTQYATAKATEEAFDALLMLNLLAYQEEINKRLENYKL